MSAGRVGIPFVVAAPSGTGKTTVCRRIVEGDPLVAISISHTTRPPRASERDGEDYYFVDREQFERLASAGAFLEWAEYNGNLYGTSWRAIEEPLGQGHDVLLEIEVQGAAQVRERRGDARLVFLLPPSLKVLEERLRRRGSDAPGEIARRLAVATRELEAGRGFDYAVLNDDLDRCVSDVEAIVRGERAGQAQELRARFEPGAAIAALQGR